MLAFVFAVAILVAVVAAGLFDWSLKRKVLLHLGVGFVTALLALPLEGEYAKHVLHEVYLEEYLQFIFIPLVTVFAAALGLFKVQAAPGAKLGWFLLIATPLVANFGTTWAMVPLGLSLIPILKESVGNSWKYLMVKLSMFTMNLVAVGTLLADPPQAFWAVKQADAGTPLSFFYPAELFWPYLLTIMLVFANELWQEKIPFGSPLELFAVKPVSWPKVIGGTMVAACVGISVTLLKGYAVTGFLVGVMLIMTLFSFGKSFTRHERHYALDWSIETATTFVAFFSVVAWARMGLHHYHVQPGVMVPIVIVKTMFADNAAAFAVAYPTLEPFGRVLTGWYGLFNAVTYGAMTPVGNGPQIVLFLVILVAMKEITVGEVWRLWMKEALELAPFLLVWTFGACWWQGGHPTTESLFIISAASLIVWKIIDQFKTRAHL